MENNKLKFANLKVGLTVFGLIVIKNNPGVIPKGAVPSLFLTRVLNLSSATVDLCTIAFLITVISFRSVIVSQFKGSVVLNFVNYGCDPSLNNVVSKQLLALGHGDKLGMP